MSSAWPSRLILFGGTGDLAARSLFPALAALAEDGRLPDPFHVLASGSREQTDEEWRARVQESLDEHADDTGDAARRRILDAVRYQRADISNADDIAALVAAVPGDGPLLAYLAVPPSMFADAVRGLHAAGL